MLFTKINIDNNCDCISDSVENLSDTFVRKVRRSEELKNPDFRSHFERGKSPSTNECAEICGLHGISIELWNEHSRTILLSKYTTTAAFSPKSKNNLCVLKFNSSCGMIKHTPNQIEYNLFHYDFYKEDSFDVSKLNLVAMIPITA